MTAPNLAAVRMARRLTTPFGRGADTRPLTLRAGGTALATVDLYDYGDHAARFGRAPEPAYVIAARRDVDAATVVSVSFVDPSAGASTATLAVPAGTRAGASFALSLPVSATGRVTQVSVAPAPADGRVDLAWSLTALLGNLAKLLWVIGGERDQLREEAVRTVAQRHLPTALGLSLDLIGFDLGVPRFPPLPYGFDADTVALYHLDDEAGATPAVADATAAYPGRTGHPGTLVGPVRVGVAGRYGRAMAFRGAATPVQVQVASSPAFDIPATASATVEFFVRPDADTADAAVLSRHPTPLSDGPGWTFAVGSFNQGLARNVAFTVGDGAGHSVALLANVNLPTDAFSHVAAVIDRASGRAVLYVDGVPRATQALGQLGAVVNTAPLRAGAVVGPFHGTLDEVRLSSVARTGFAPALGEDDGHYRRRLRLFRRWSLPTPANLTAMLNELAGPIGGRADALVVDDSNAPLVRGTRLVRIRPVELRPGECLDGAGRRRVSEAAAVGTADQEDTFDPAFLFREDRTDVDYTPAPPRGLDPGEAPPDPHLMQIGVAERLDRLVALVAAETTPPGRLLIDGAFDPRAGDLRATGRAILIGHATVAPGRLAALAHRAGFDYVCHRAESDTAGQVYAASAPGDYFAIQLDPADAGPTDLTVGATATLSLRPPPPKDAFLRWLIVPGGAGRGTVTPVGVPGSPRRTATLTPAAAGRLVVKVDLTMGRHSVSATRSLHIGLTDLADGASVAADGTPGAPESIVDGPVDFFHPAFLRRHDDPRVNYGTVDDHHRMQPAVGELLDALLAELDRRGVTGQLSVTAAFDATGDRAAAEGRRLVLRHGVLAPGALAAVAHAVGFGHTRRGGADVVVRQAPGQLVAVRGPAGVDTAAILELDEGTGLDLTAAPAPAALAGSGLPGPLPGEGPRLSWASGAFDAAELALGSDTQPTNRLAAVGAGMAWVQASYLIGAGPPPYTFQVRLRPELDTPDTIITKDQHDLIMNVLNVLHPVGVEVSTAAIRAHVVEIRGDLLLANPDYTYPKFRVRGRLPRQVKGSPRG